MQNLLTKRLRLSLGRWCWSPPLWGVLLAALGMGLFSRFGLWQLERAEEKALITARFEARLQSPPLGLQQLLAQGQDIEDLPVRLPGRFDNARQVFLENQPYRGRAGFHVYTVFFPTGERAGILVNRGWVATAQDMQSLPGVPPAEARGGEIMGRAAWPSPFFTVGEPDYSTQPLRVGRLKIEQISQALGVELRPFVIRLDSAAPDGLVRDWTPAARLGIPPEKHQAYAFQWFSLAAAVLGVLIAVNLRRRREDSSHE